MALKDINVWEPGCDWEPEIWSLHGEDRRKKMREFAELAAELSREVNQRLA